MNARCQSGARFRVFCRGTARPHRVQHIAEEFGPAHPRQLSQEIAEEIPGDMQTTMTLENLVASRFKYIMMVAKSKNLTTADYQYVTMSTEFVTYFRNHIDKINTLDCDIAVRLETIIREGPHIECHRTELLDALFKKVDMSTDEPDEKKNDSNSVPKQKLKFFHNYLTGPLWSFLSSEATDKVSAEFRVGQHMEARGMLWADESIFKDAATIIHMAHPLHLSLIHI